MNPKFWLPERPKHIEWNQTRMAVLERDNYICAFCGHRAIKWMNIHHIIDSTDNNPENLVPLCVACHAVMHCGLSLSKNTIEIWKCDMSQVEIVKYTREGVKKGLSLADIRSKLPISLGNYPPNSMSYANDLIKRIGNRPRAYLDEPLCAIFVNLNRWHRIGVLMQYY